MPLQQRVAHPVPPARRARFRERDIKAACGNAVSPTTKRGLVRTGTLAYLLGPRFHRLSWSEWGDPDAPVVVCVHGLTRTGRDFDTLAEALSDRARVVAPDLPGRGGSEWLHDPAAYAPATYLQALSHLLAALGATAGRPVAWVGTSLGGILGMLVAASEGQPISRLVLNDVGPHIPRAALARIAAYMGDAPRTFADHAALDAHIRKVHAPFGALTDAQWSHLARTSARPLPDGSVALHYDPAIAIAMLATPPADVDLWPVWASVGVPRMVVRGADSDLLEPATAARMAAEGARLVVVPGAGHAPALMDRPTIDGVRDFLFG